MSHSQPPARVSLATIAREWGRIGITGFGGPPAHIALLRQTCVDRRGWMSAAEFEDGIAATSLLPGPASTQLAIFCAWRLRAAWGAIVGGLCFILPGFVVIIGLSALFLAHNAPRAVLGAAAGAGAAVPIVALRAASSLVPASWRRSTAGAGGEAVSSRRIPGPKVRWGGYALAGALLAALAGPYLVIGLLGCGLVEVIAQQGRKPLRSNGLLLLPGLRPGRGPGLFPRLLPGLGSGLAAAGAAGAGLLALVWVTFKVGALSYGGGFVIIPLMQHDVVSTYHWMTSTQFLGGVALGQVTPGPVVLTVSVIGYAAAGFGGALLAMVVAFTPSFCFVLTGARHFTALRRSGRVQAFLLGAGPAAIGAIAGSALPLALALRHLWQVGVLVLAACWLLAGRRSVVAALLGSGALGVVLVLAGAPISR